MSKGKGNDKRMDRGGDADHTGKEDQEAAGGAISAGAAGETDAGESGTAEAPAREGATRGGEGAERPAPEEESTRGWGTVRKWVPLFVLALSLAIILIDATLLNVSLATIIQDLDTTIQKIQWVITAYSLTIAALMITGGRLGDLYGRKKMFMLGALIFAVGSYICSISPNVPVMIIGESIIEGIGAALMMPATMSLLVSTYRGRDRAIAFGIWGGVAGAATAIGPLVGGYITSNYSWRWAFRINVFVAAVLLAGAFAIKESRDREEKPELDWLGVILSASGMFFLVYGIIESSTYGWVMAKEPFSLFGWVTFGTISVSLYAIVLGTVILAGFFAWEKIAERRGRTPLVSLRLFKNRQFISGASIVGLIALGQAGLIFSLPVFLQAVRGYDAFHTGLALIPLSAAALIAAPISGVVANRVGPKPIIQAGMLSIICGYTLQILIWNVDSTVTDFIPSLILVGMGMGLMMGQMNNLTLSAVSVEQAGEASGVNNTFRQLGMTLGTAIIGAVLITSIAASLSSGVQASTVIPEPYKGKVDEAISEQVSNVEFGGGAELPDYIPQEIGDEIISISHDAVTKANRIALTFSASFTLLALLASFILPSGRINERDDNLAASSPH
jgi:EmrB/QacA subfamily drug resistance transporter